MNNHDNLSNRFFFLFFNENRTKFISIRKIHYFTVLCYKLKFRWNGDRKSFTTLRKVPIITQEPRMTRSRENRASHWHVSRRPRVGKSREGKRWKERKRNRKKGGWKGGKKWVLM